MSSIKLLLRFCVTSDLISSPSIENCEAGVERERTSVQPMKDALTNRHVTPVFSGLRDDTPDVDRKDTSSKYCLSEEKSGRILLSHQWKSTFSSDNLCAGQWILTRSRRHLNASPPYRLPHTHAHARDSHKNIARFVSTSLSFPPSHHRWWMHSYINRNKLSAVYISQVEGGVWGMGIEFPILQQHQAEKSSYSLATPPVHPSVESPCLVQ